MLERFKHIVIEGPIGAGKTSLTRRLAARLAAGLVLEEPQANPFLERFYRDSVRYALPTQLFFLFQRVNQLRDLAQRDLFARQFVADFLLEKDPLFAALTLDDEELKLYRQIYASLAPQAPDPDLVILLEAQPDTLIERIARRGRPSETAISEPYLRELITQLRREFDFQLVRFPDTDDYGHALADLAPELVPVDRLAGAGGNVVRAGRL